MDSLRTWLMTNQNMMPSMSPVGLGGAAGQSAGLAAAPVARLILQSGPGRFDSGATYAGCSRDNPGACQGQEFASLDDAIRYAYANGEYPVLVGSEDEGWAIVAGQTHIDSSRVLPAPPPVAAGGSVVGGISTPMLIGGAVLAFFLLRKKL